MISIVAGLVGLLLIGALLWDAFETIVLPRRVSVQFRLSRLFFRLSSRLWLALGRRIRSRRRRDDFLGIYGPLALLWLLATWAVGLVVGFAILLWALGSPLKTPEGGATGPDALYMSGTTFFTLGLGDVIPQTRLARLTVVVEAGLGFGFLALVISYLPILYQDFSRRETRISMLDEWAGSPPTAEALLTRLGREQNLAALDPFLQEWEQWAAELLESYLSYPVLAFFRSQHEHQSWLGALTLMLDTCALVIVGVEDVKATAAHRTFAMSRHALVDLGQIFDATPRPSPTNRLPPADLAALRQRLEQAGVHLRAGSEAEQKLASLREFYEPYAHVLAEALVFDLPPWLRSPEAKDNWQTSAFESPDDAHF
jgi:Ion channel